MATRPEWRKVYLGDSVYVEVESGMLKLTTENGFGPSNTIFLELEVYDALVRYVERIKATPPPIDPQGFPLPYDRTPR